MSCPKDYPQICSSSPSCFLLNTLTQTHFTQPSSGGWRRLHSKMFMMEKAISCSCLPLTTGESNGESHCFHTCPGQFNCTQKLQNTQKYLLYPLWHEMFKIQFVLYLECCAMNMHAQFDAPRPHALLKVLDATPRIHPK